jgi:hypothetical protein
MQEEKWKCRIFRKKQENLKYRASMEGEGVENPIHYRWLTILIKPRKTMRELISSG